MTKRDNIKVRGVVTLLVAMFFASAFLVRCASIGRPTGGPSDTLPPVILSMLPNNYTTNVDTMPSKIYIEFDEFIQLKDQQKNFFSSPAMKSMPKLEMKGRGVIISINDTLKPNTTYALNFGSTIADNNEGNPLSSFRYVFSTGNSIDSMILSGYTEDSFKSDSVSGTIVMLYPADSVELNTDYDSTLYNSTPAVIAKAENNGIFMAQNLKPIPYYIYAFKDENSNYIYEPGTDQVGFISGTRNPAELDDFAMWLDTARKYIVAEPQLHFRMFLEEPFKRQILSESGRTERQRATLEFAAPYPIIDSIIFDKLEQDQFELEFTEDDHSKASIWFNMTPELIPDTLLGRIVYFKHDSLNNLSRTSEKLKFAWKYIETKEEAQKREKLEKDRAKAEESGEEWVEPKKENPFKVNYNTSKELNPEKKIAFDFALPISKIDSSLISFTRLTAKEQEYLKTLEERSKEGDSLAKAQLAKNYQGKSHPFKFERDTQDIKRWYLTTQLDEGVDKFFLDIPAGAFTDFAGAVNDSISYDFSLLQREKFATIILKIKEDQENPSEYIVELLDKGEKVIDTKYVNKSDTLTFKYVTVDTEVSIRMVQDLNGNGKWDSGNLIQRRQPELSRVATWSGKEGIATKANWEVELDIDPAVLFAPESQADLAKRLEQQEIARIQTLRESKEKIEGKKK